MWKKFRNIYIYLVNHFLRNDTYEAMPNIAKAIFPSFAVQMRNARVYSSTYSSRKLACFFYFYDLIAVISGKVNGYKSVTSVDMTTKKENPQKKMLSFELASFFYGHLHLVMAGSSVFNRLMAESLVFNRRRVCVWISHTSESYLFYGYISFCLLTVCLFLLEAFASIQFL